MPTILLVSNSVAEREVHARSLRTSGYRVMRTATTGLAYQIATTRTIDLVVADGHIAGSMNGLEFTRRLRSHARTSTLPIILLTSVTRRQDGELSIKAGADMFLETPVSGDVLRAHVARLLVARAQGSETPHPADRRTCPECRECLEYRHKWPVLSAAGPNAYRPRERLRYESGWFCSNPACEYQESARHRE